MDRRKKNKINKLSLNLNITIPSSGGIDKNKEDGRFERGKRNINKIKVLQGQEKKNPAKNKKKNIKKNKLKAQ